MPKLYKMIENGSRECPVIHFLSGVCPKITVKLIITLIMLKYFQKTV
jgi:hypothetical protein